MWATFCNLFYFIYTLFSANIELKDIHLLAFLVPNSVLRPIYQGQ